MQQDSRKLNGILGHERNMQSPGWASSPGSRTNLNMVREYLSLAYTQLL